MADKFGNGVEVAIEMKRVDVKSSFMIRSVMHQAYILALYRHRPELICRMKACY